MPKETLINRKSTDSPGLAKFIKIDLVDNEYENNMPFKYVPNPDEKHVNLDILRVDRERMSNKDTSVSVTRIYFINNSI